jgi:hypothetical protein
MEEDQGVVQRRWSELLTAPKGDRLVRAHPNKGCVLWTVDASSNATTTSVSAGQHLCGAPRRNRTGDPILTMDLAVTAMLTGVSADRWRPWDAKLCAVFR